MVARSLDGRCLLLGEAKWHPTPVRLELVEKAASDLLRKGVPPWARHQAQPIVRVVCFPEIERKGRQAVRGVTLVDARQVLGALR